MLVTREKVGGEVNPVFDEFVTCSDDKWADDMVATSRKNKELEVFVEKERIQ